MVLSILSCKDEEKERKKQEKRKEKLEKSSSTLKAEVARSIPTGFLLIYPLSNKDPLPLDMHNKIPGQLQEDTSYKQKLFLELDEENYANLYIPIPLAGIELNKTFHPKRDCSFTVTKRINY